MSVSEFKERGAMPGPLPDPNALNPNKRHVPVHVLPAGGLGVVPDLPGWVELRADGQAFWQWAWSQPQSAGWGTESGFEVVVARRALLEDDLADAEKVNERLAVYRQMLALDEKLGLTPKDFAALRWTLAGSEAESAGDDEVSKRREERRKAALG